LVPILLFSSQNNKELIPLAVRAGVTDIFNFPLDRENIELRVDFLITHWERTAEEKIEKQQPYFSPATKQTVIRLFFAGLALLMLSPLFLLIYIWIRLESKGPAFIIHSV
jgi:hypothetical protein